VERAASLAQRITRAPPVGRNGADAARRRAGTDGLCAAERDRPLPVAGLCSRRLSTSGGTRFSSSHRNKRGQRSQQNDRRKKLRRNMSHLRLLFHLISRLYERTSIRPVGHASNVPLDPWRPGSFSRQSGQPDCRHFVYFIASAGNFFGSAQLGERKFGELPRASKHRPEPEVRPNPPKSPGP